MAVVMTAPGFIREPALFELCRLKGYWLRRCRMPPEARNRNIIPRVQMNPANLIKMDIHNYDELKKKFEALLEENNCLKAKIRKLETDAEAVIPLHESVRPRETLFQEPEEPESSRQSIATALNDTSCNNKSVTCRISMHSQNHEKIALFMSQFKGRTDVYAKKWQNKKGLTGYSPVCLNEWTPGVCNKPNTKCSRY